MNYGQAKERTLKIIDEYSLGTGELCDEHILVRLPTAIDIAQKELSKVRRSIGRICMAELDTIAGDEHTRVPPRDFVSIRRVWHINEETKGVEIFSGSIHIPKNLSPEKLYLEYVRFPNTIDSTTSDDTVIDLPLDICEALPFLAAMVLSAGETGVDASGIREIYNMIMSGVNTAECGSILVVKNGLGV